MIVIFADHRIWDQSQASVNKNIKPRFVCGLWQRKLHLFLQQVRDMRERVSCGVVERMDGVEMARNDSQSVKQSVLCHQSVSYVVIITHYCCTQLTLLTHHYRQYLYSDTAQHSLQSTKSYNPFPQTNTLFTDSKTNISIYF